MLCALKHKNKTEIDRSYWILKIKDIYNTILISKGAKKFPTLLKKFSIKNVHTHIARHNCPINEGKPRRSSTVRCLLKYNDSSNFSQKYHPF